MTDASLRARHRGRGATGGAWRAQHDRGDIIGSTGGRVVEQNVQIPLLNLFLVAEKGAQGHGRQWPGGIDRGEPLEVHRPPLVLQVEFVSWRGFSGRLSRRA